MKAFVMILFCASSLFGQSSADQICRNKRCLFYQELNSQAEFIEECKFKTKQTQIKKFGRILLKIAGRCEWGSNGCPLRLVKPLYPDNARRNRMSGPVKVEIIIDETGKVVFANAFQGNRIFYSNAERAASRSRFYPLTLCGKSVWQKRVIVYNFLPI